MVLRVFVYSICFSTFAFEIYIFKERAKILQDISEFIDFRVT